MTITKQDRAFERKIWRRSQAGKHVSRKDLLRAIDIKRALRKEAERQQAEKTLAHCESFLGI